jgi:cyclohexyl-isocyanide hydratase
LLKGRKATTHWASHHLLQYFGATPVHQRVVQDGTLMTCAGVTAGIDGALRLASLLRDDRAAQQIQLHLEYAPEPPFDCGDASRAPAALVQAGRDSLQAMLQERLAIVQRAAKRMAVA